MNVPQKFGGLRLIGTILLAWGIIVVAGGLIVGLILLTGNFFEGYNRGINLIGWIPLISGLVNGLPPIVLGKAIHLLVDVEYNTRLAVQSAEQARQIAEVAVKNSESLLKTTETLMRNTELAMKNLETAAKGKA
ncbi:MAG: hypothetical protein RMM31_06430 [Anaerolineae bacterium]|nr:hypothetical protein [Thermoflexales bacterium]MDW8395859.1 hypothetical protein [Anaerolineae bacterium]